MPFPLQQFITGVSVDTLQPRIKVQQLTTRHCLVKRDALGQIAERAAPGRRPRCNGILTKDGDFPRTRSSQSQQQFHQGCLAGSVMPDEHETLAGRDGQIDAIENPCITIGLGHIAKFDRQCPGD